MNKLNTMELYQLNELVEDNSLLSDTMLTIEIDKGGSISLLSVDEIYYIEESEEPRIVAHVK